MVFDKDIFRISSLETHTLSQKLSWLISDSGHIAACYADYAYLSQREYAEAALICLKAVEQNRLSLLSEIPPNLVSLCNTCKAYTYETECTYDATHYKK